MSVYEDALAGVLAGLKNDLSAFYANQNERYKAMVSRMDEIEVRASRPPGRTWPFDSSGTLADALHDSPEWKAFSMTGRGGFAIAVPDFQRKATLTISGVGSSVSGVMPIQRVGGIIPAALRTFRLRELLRQPPVDTGLIDFVRVKDYDPASPVSEGSDKGQNAINFEAASAKVECLATWLPASRQILQDLTGLQEAVNVHLLAALMDLEDVQILFGDGNSPNLSGLTTQAAAWNISLLTANDGYEYPDIISGAIQQVRASRYNPTGIVLNPADWGKMTRLKDSTGRYIIGDPQTATETRLWGLPCAVTDAMTAGHFLVGDFVTGAALAMRMDGVIEVSDSHSDYFIKNLLAIRCEERVALLCYKPNAFVYGSLTQSPA